MKTTPGRKAPARQSCVFRSRFVRDEIDPKVKDLWERTTGNPAPFGRLRMNFQREHCRAINPYGGECPYREEECGQAFLDAVRNCLLPWVTNPAAYFVKVAKSSGITRADNKPLAREMHRGPQGPGHAGSPRSGTGEGRQGDLDGLGGPHPPRGVVPQLLGDEDEDRLRRATHRPQPIGDLLGSLNLGPRQGPAENGSTSAK
jgi:hypothetical protein